MIREVRLEEPASVENVKISASQRTTGNQASRWRRIRKRPRAREGVREPESPSDISVGIGGLAALQSTARGRVYLQPRNQSSSNLRWSKASISVAAREASCPSATRVSL